ncbi:BgTH12-01792 [Blumeria graminis f. sp. triticale]|uniref:U3 small nucleolar RNA-associated protein 11 n=1 Tax=Blumeria graminis f. sp. triticale TaxID=1689686 RepID=A0A9W4D576_BLUGR|nr:BgTH12-01792 [Blumeria graminis f. sp. triticale]
MSTMRNAVQRRVHRERGQPEDRQKWGLLEKHKDYSARARDFNAKKAKLKALRQKVLERNPDEFYFGMLSRAGPSSAKGRKGTVSADRGNQVLSQDAVRLLKTQDLGYIRTARNRAAKEMERLEMAAKGIVGSGRKLVFMGEPSDQSEDSAMVDHMLEENEIVSPSARKQKQQSQSNYEKLNARLATSRERLKTLTQVEEALELQRAKMAKSPTVGGVNKDGKKFRVRDRKK